jgi:hypothetical protein
MYLKERIIIATVLCTSFISLYFIPREKYRQATFLFLFTQLPSWIFGLLAVETGLIEYPVRELAKASGTSFTFEFLVLPLICVFFNLNYPEEKGASSKIKFYFTILSIFTLIEYFTEKYTLIIQYLYWEWYITFATMGAIIYFVRVVYKWFFNIKKPFAI